MIPTELSDRLLFLSDHTCCVCCEDGRPVQIHHIDDDPSNGSENNLAVMCLFCHHETQVSGGFAKHLSPGEIANYRDNWLARVAKRRDAADMLATAKQSTDSTDVIADPSIGADADIVDRRIVNAYIAGIPEIMRKAYEICEANSNDDVTSHMVQSARSIVDVLETIWLQLAAGFPSNHFSDWTPSEFISNYKTLRYRWHRAILEPEGPGSNGSMVRPMIVWAVAKDLET